MKKIFVIFVVMILNCFALDDVSTDNTIAASTQNVQNNQSTQNSQSIPGAYNFFFHNQSLRDCLASFAKSNGLEINISRELPKRILSTPIKGRFIANSGDEFLRSFSHQYGFDWFVFSGTLYITSLKQVTDSIEVAPEGMYDIHNHLEQIGLLIPKFGYSELGSQNKIVITGPVEYVDIVAREIGGLDLHATNQQFAIFRLKYANATDTQLTFNNQQVIIPGVATILQQLTGGGSGGKGRSKVSSNVAELLKNKSIESSGINSDNSPDDKNFISTPQIEADARLNTIIIRDKSSNLELYRNIIKELDVPAPLIQIEVLIVRLDQDKLAEKGINWWVSKNTYAGGFGAQNLTGGISNNLSLSYQQINPGQLIVTNMGSFATNLQFLENNQYAKTDARPSLATIDNLPAVISTTDNIFSTTLANANPNTANTVNNNNNNNNFAYNGIQLIQSLQITPHVINSIDKNGKPIKQIKLSIVLQDGSVNELSNQQMPNYSQGYINSQAVVSEGQSLILAGYTKNTTISVETKVPGLGDIPGLGWLFKSSTRLTHKITTLYVVTPKIVSSFTSSSSAVHVESAEVL